MTRRLCSFEVSALPRCPATAQSIAWSGGLYELVFHHLVPLSCLNTAQFDSIIIILYNTYKSYAIANCFQSPWNNQVDQLYSVKLFTGAPSYFRHIFLATQCWRCQIFLLVRKIKEKGTCALPPLVRAGPCETMSFVLLDGGLGTLAQSLFSWFSDVFRSLLSFERTFQTPTRGASGCI